MYKRPMRTKNCAGTVFSCEYLEIFWHLWFVINLSQVDLFHEQASSLLYMLHVANQVLQGPQAISYNMNII